ncbi:MAG: efflux transporter periplasmic adaptor subunit [Leptolyngbya foveolarum]|uniref:Efflux transporter periplasmic adaptor subunit n=1 Tax=Leptolyngbya foveolarum TaxID=47253 RepID=A0A2W4UTB0_9CYAN|nr:MAG: efflux transporter periplasmic adaptor subunit [Leptolyngbya foveolarum]
MSSLSLRAIKRPGRWLIGLGLVGLIAFGAIALVRRSSQPDYDLSELTVEVNKDAITVRITASGTIEPVRSVNLSPKTAGTVEELYVEQGDQVEKGQVIARMDNEQINAQIVQSKAGVAEARAQLDEALRGPTSTDIRQVEASVSQTRAQLEDARARLALAEDEATRDQSLFNRGAISRSDLDRVLSDRRSANANLDQAFARLAEAEQRLVDAQNGSESETIAQAEARLSRAQGQLQSAQAQLADTEIRTPFAGIITQRFASEGAFVTPTATASDVTSATSTAIVALASGLEVIAEVSEADINKIRVGQSVEIQADAFPEEVFEGQVKLIAPEAIERQNVTVFQVRVALLTGTNQLRSNMNTTVSFIGDQLDDALVIPAVAVITQSGETGVLVPDDAGQAQFMPVVLGSQVGDRIQVVDGLESGDRVFIDLPPGQSLENLTFGRR